MRPNEALCGSGGELVMVRLTVTAKDLEETLETLAELDFPVNPELFHRGAETTIEFPAYTGKLNRIFEVLQDKGALETVSMLAEIGL
jgi:hypothetical protein